jgi:hypothetical protein
MMIAIWLLALILLLFWSAFAWMIHALLGMLSGLPWEQVLSKLKGLSLPAPFGEWWVMMVDLLAPVLQVSLPLLQGLLSFAGGALPVIVFVVWLLGATVLLLIAIAATVGGVWWRKNSASLKGKLPRI